LGGGINATDAVDLFVRYRAASARERLLVPLLHFTAITGLSPGVFYSLNVTADQGNRVVDYDPTNPRLLVSVPSPGTYSVLFSSPTGGNGTLCNGNVPFFIVGAGDSFLAEAFVCGSSPLPGSSALPSSALPNSVLPSSATVSSAFVTSSDASSETNVGLIAGLSVAGAVILIIIISLVIYICRDPFFKKHDPD
jgi:hypothetical protein